MKKTLILGLSLLAIGSSAFAQLHVTSGTSKNVLFEEAAGAWTGWNPDGQQDIIQSVQPIPHAIVMSWHNGDSMMVPGDPYCTGAGFIVGFPDGTIDRAMIGGSIQQSRPWESAVSTRTSLTPNFQVDMDCNYNPSTRVMYVTVSGKALAALTGNWSINAFICEDSIPSVGTGYSQRSYYNTTTTASNGNPSWYFGLGDPLPPASYYHMDVVRAALASGGSIWGDPSFINPPSGTTNSRSYSFTLPAGYNADKVFVVGVVQKVGTAPGDSVIENAVSSKGSTIPAGALVAYDDSMYVYTSDLCSSSNFFITTLSSSGLTIATDFGDGTTASNSVLATISGGYINLTHSYPTSGTYTVKHIMSYMGSPVDSISYTHTYVLCNQFPVSFYFDANGNCTKDSTEPFISQPFLTRVDSNGVAVDTISSTSGFYYNAYGNPGDIYRFTVISTPPGLTITCPTGGIADTIGADSTIYPKLFGVNCTGSSAFDLRLATTVRPGRHHFSSTIIVDNTYCTPTSGVVTMELTPKYDFTSAYPAPTSVSGHTITWNFTGLSSVDLAPHYINVTADVPGAWLIPGDTVQNDYIITPTSGDINPANNSCSQSDTIRSSYDPNHMDVFPSGYITAPATLEYTIEFENTGNDTAHNIYVMDTLSASVLPNTLKIMSSSAAMFVTSYHDNSGRNIIKFDFPHIMLPDSSHHNQCNGMVIFQINTKSGLPVGTTIYNHAGIFFDDNPVVMTNTVLDIIKTPNATPVITNEGSIRIAPNPATDHLNITMEGTPFSSFNITNSMGQVFMERQLSAAQSVVDIKELPAGLYYINLKGENGSKVQKFIKL